MTYPVPTLSFGTIRRHIWLLNIFAFAKIDPRPIDVGARLIAVHRTIAIDFAVRIIRIIRIFAAAHDAIRADVAEEIRSIARHIGRDHSAANI